MNNTKENPATFVTGFSFGAPEETRTPDLLIRSHKSETVTICNFLTSRVIEKAE